MTFKNFYEDDAYAGAYAKLEFPDTYYLAFRDLPVLFTKHVAGKRALDFGCGTGRSTRFLRKLGFETIGIDVAEKMVQRARESDPTGEYRCISDGDLDDFRDGTFDLVFSAFTFDNIPTRTHKVRLFTELARVLAPTGRLVNVVSSPEIYLHEWASFSSKDFPENRQARCGDRVLIINTALTDRRPVTDILWPDADYRDVYSRAGLAVLEIHRPLGRPDEPYAWINETTIPPWTIYVLGKGGDSGP